MERRDLVLQGWDIDHKDIEIAKHEDGTEWLLGAGSYGKACLPSDLCMPFVPSPADKACTSVVLSPARS